MRNVPLVCFTKFEKSCHILGWSVIAGGGEALRKCMQCINCLSVDMFYGGVITVLAEYL